MAGGADLVADDRVEIRTGAHPASGPEGAASRPVLVARAPLTIAGLIEARGVGILRVPYQDEVEIAFVVDLSQSETARLPPQRLTSLLGVQLPLVLRGADVHFHASVLCYLKGTRHA
jgi:HPr kinase/phosphorylase